MTENQNPLPIPDLRSLRLPFWFPVLFFFLLALIFLWRPVFTGEVFLPAQLLSHVAPWKGTELFADVPPWNPLRWDSIGYFYPSRLFAAETYRAGYIPLWNPYQLCGAPFLANNQSAIFYPGNWLLYLLPDIAYGFTINAVLHLTLCGWFMYLLLKRLGRSEIAALLGGVVFTYSAWQAAWLQLPSFLATSCWFPLLLYFMVPRAEAKPRLENVAKIGAVVGVLLLAGHLQIAFYGLLLASAWGIFHLISLRRHRMQRLVVYVCGGLLGIALAMPQLLPAVELSRVSHRQSRPSAEGYAAYTEYAVPLYGMASLFVPEFQGEEFSTTNPYWGFYTKQIENVTIGIRHNPAETAAFVGIVPLLLGIFATVRILFARTFQSGAVLLFFAAVGLVSLLLAFGSPLNALPYFGIPGFGQTGSPARCLVLWVLSMAVLAAFGLDMLYTQKVSKREGYVVLGIPVLLLALGLNFAVQSLATPPVGINGLPSLAEAVSRSAVGWLFAGLSFGIALAFLYGKISLPKTQPYFVAPSLLGLVVVVELFRTGMGVNPTAKREQVYPQTPALTYLQREIGHERVVPINQRWSLIAPANFNLPTTLPPNTAMVFKLRDAQGYDSLFPGVYKQFANRFALPTRSGLVDASPPEVGNMVFIQNANAPDLPLLGAKFALALPYGSPGIVSASIPNSTPLDTSDKNIAIYPMDGIPSRVALEPAVPQPSVKFLEDGATRVVLEVETSVPTTLILRDTYYPGWRANSNGTPVPILQHPENPVYRGVNLAAGKHKLTFQFLPTSFRIGIYVAFLALSFQIFCLTPIILRRFLKESIARNVVHP